MSPESLTLLGYIAGAITTGSFLPQVYKTYTSKSVEDLSYWMLLLMFTGLTLWFLYGVELNELPIILTNGITGALVISLIAMKYLFTKKYPDRNIEQQDL